VTRKYIEKQTQISTAL